MSTYVGPERRRGERRQRETMNIGDPRDRRSYGPDADRRQQALSGVIAGLTAKEMEQLAGVWQAIERASTQPEGG